jgi:hypothetical protein
MQPLTKEQILASSNLIATVTMEHLIDLGWDFTGDYEDDGSESKPDTFDKWVDNCQVQIFFRSGRSQYVIREYKGPQKGWTDWAELPTGDDDKTADDILELYESGHYLNIEDDDDYPR